MWEPPIPIDSNFRTGCHDLQQSSSAINNQPRHFFLLDRSQDLTSPGKSVNV
jgi:hypothetical protein